MDKGSPRQWDRLVRERLDLGEVLVESTPNCLLTEGLAELLGKRVARLNGVFNALRRPRGSFGSFFTSMKWVHGLRRRGVFTCRWPLVSMTLSVPTMPVLGLKLRFGNRYEIQ
jgi:hypothetical protein